MRTTAAVSCSVTSGCDMARSFRRIWRYRHLYRCLAWVGTVFSLTLLAVFIGTFIPGGMPYGVAICWRDNRPATGWRIAKIGITGGAGFSLVIPCIGHDGGKSSSAAKSGAALTLTPLWIYRWRDRTGWAGDRLDAGVPVIYLAAGLVCRIITDVAIKKRPRCDTWRPPHLAY